MNFYEKLSLFLTFLVGIIIFCWSGVPGMGGGSENALLPILYHFGIFALLSGFLFLSFYKKISGGNVFLGFLILIIYAVLDEVHQLYVPNRGCRVFDVSIDFAGILAGFLFIVVFGGFLKLVRR